MTFGKHGKHSKVPRMEKHSKVPRLGNDWRLWLGINSRLTDYESDALPTAPLSPSSQKTVVTAFIFHI